MKTKTVLIGLLLAGITWQNTMGQTVRSERRDVPMARTQEDPTPGMDPDRFLPSYTQLTQALKEVVDVGGDANAGLGNNMWAVVVNRDGIVQNVTMSGDDRGDQWPGSRVIAAQKANTANAFSLPGLALSTANLYTAVQPGGSLFGLQESNPVDPAVAYQGPERAYGKTNDPMVGHKIGGVNVFGGGLPLYTPNGDLIGAVGVSGDTSCTDHVVAWKLRHQLNLDNVPGGPSPTGDDNIVFDITLNEDGHSVSGSGWGHASCGGDVETIANELPNTHPIGSDQ